MHALLRLRRAARTKAVALRLAWLRRVIGYDIGPNCRISFSANLDKTNPAGVHIGDYTGVALGVVILSHDFTMNRHVDTYIGARCMIGANAIIAPGVRVGDGSIVGPGSVVLANIPPNSVAIGNPARVVERDIRVGRWGVRIDRLEPDRIDPKVVGDLTMGNEE